MVLLCALLFFPALAAGRLAQTIDGRWIAGYALLISAVTYFLYWDDKQSAREGEWRTAEATLHLFELLGGWPGAFLAQRAIRHKISKGRYQISFWMVIALYEFVSFDFTHDWQYSMEALALLAR